MVGWREPARRASEATLPIDVLQERGKTAEAIILSLKEKYPNWHELEPGHPVQKELLQQERECVEKIAILKQRGAEPVFGCGKLNSGLQPTPIYAALGEATVQVAKHQQPTMGEAGKHEPAGTEWFDSDPDVVRRRLIVLKNPKMSSKSLCKTGRHLQYRCRATGGQNSALRLGLKHIKTRPDANAFRRSSARIGGLGRPSNP